METPYTDQHEERLCILASTADEEMKVVPARKARLLEVALRENQAFVKELLKHTVIGTKEPIEKWIRFDDQQYRLLCGEITPQEIRTVKAVLTSILSEVNKNESI